MTTRSPGLTQPASRAPRTAAARRSSVLVVAGTSSGRTPQMSGSRLNVVWLAVAAITWRDTRHELDELLDSHLAQAAALLVAQQTGEIGDAEHSVDALMLHRYAPKVVFQIFHEGRLVLRSANAPAAPLIAPASGFKAGFETVHMQGTVWRVFSAYGAEKVPSDFIRLIVMPL